MPAGTEISGAVLASGHWRYSVLPALLAGKREKNGAKAWTLEDEIIFGDSGNHLELI
jgi:hypothetical protein